MYYDIENLIGNSKRRKSIRLYRGNLLHTAGIIAKADLHRYYRSNRESILYNQWPDSKKNRYYRYVDNRPCLSHALLKRYFTHLECKEGVGRGWGGVVVVGRIDRTIASIDSRSPIICVVRIMGKTDRVPSIPPENRNGVKKLNGQTRKHAKV